MPLSDLWTRAQLRTSVRAELLDPSAKFWPDAELNTYIERWQNYLQSEFEFVWGTATALVGIGTSTLNLSAVDSTMMRIDAVYWNTSTSTAHRLTPRSKEELDVIKRDWRLDSNGTDPRVVYQDDLFSCSFWPPPGVAGTATFEHPVSVTFGGADVAMVIPAWTKYSCKNFVVEHALLRHGPNQDINRALRRRKKFIAQAERFKTIQANFFPDKALRLRPGGKYESDILNPARFLLR